jgi:cell division septum initiation protein DivIVA
MSEEHDVDGLLRKNSELLAEVKGLKAKVAEVEGERDEALQASSDAQDAMRKVTLEKPLETVLSGAFVAPWRVVRPLLDEHFVFDATADEGAQIRVRAEDGEGEAVALDGLMQHCQTIPDLAAMLKPASGGGASGGLDMDRATAKKDAKPKVASPFGIR